MNQRKSLHRRKARQGFSLIEIMLVVGIIATLMGGAAFMLSGNLDIAKEQRARSDILAIKAQLKTYEMLNLFLPTTEQGVEALVSPPSGEPAPRRWKQLMEEIPIDPWGTKYQYVLPGKHNPNSFDLYSLGPDRVESEDDIGNWKE